MNTHSFSTKRRVKSRSFLPRRGNSIGRARFHSARLIELLMRIRAWDPELELDCRPPGRQCGGLGTPATDTETDADTETGAVLSAGLLGRLVEQASSLLDERVRVVASVPVGSPSRRPSGSPPAPQRRADRASGGLLWGWVRKPGTRKARERTTRNIVDRARSGASWCQRIMLQMVRALPAGEALLAVVGIVGLRAGAHRIFRPNRVRHTGAWLSFRREKVPGTPSIAFREGQKTAGECRRFGLVISVSR